MVTVRVESHTRYLGYSACGVVRSVGRVPNLTRTARQFRQDRGVGVVGYPYPIRQTYNVQGVFMTDIIISQ